MTRHPRLWYGNLDGERRGMVVASSKAAAARAARTSLHHFNGFWSEHGREAELLALFAPGELWTQPSSISGGDDQRIWVRGRCKLPEWLPREAGSIWSRDRDWVSWRAYVLALPVEDRVLLPHS